MPIYETQHTNGSKTYLKFIFMFVKNYSSLKLTFDAILSLSLENSEVSLFLYLEGSILICLLR